jgi:crotonobetainyl-CoA:carnitine CoA-transferase CaiB-like acyl-CoA transferase
MLLEDGRGRKHLGVPIKFAREPAEPRLRAPGFGEHSAEIVGSLGYGDADIDRLRAERAIG